MKLSEACAGFSDRRWRRLRRRLRRALRAKDGIQRRSMKFARTSDSSCLSKTPTANLRRPLPFGEAPMWPRVALELGQA
eukprot:4034801-Pyramimonas_sp.AAC.1